MSVKSSCGAEMSVFKEQKEASVAEVVSNGESVSGLGNEVRDLSISSIRENLVSQRGEFGCALHVQWESTEHGRD